MERGDCGLISRTSRRACDAPRHISTSLNATWQTCSRDTKWIGKLARNDKYPPLKCISGRIYAILTKAEHPTIGDQGRARVQPRQRVVRPPRPPKAPPERGRSKAIMLIQLLREGQIRTTGQDTSHQAKDEHRRFRSPFSVTERNDYDEHGLCDMTANEMRCDAS